MNYNNYSTSFEMQMKNIKMENLDIKPKKKESRSTQTCVLCRNHDVNSIKRGHKDLCDFDKPEHLKGCKICQRTKKRQMSTAYEKKKIYPMQKSASKCPKVIEGDRIRDEQKCRKCLNHGITQAMRNHRKSCFFASCDCEKCAPTDARRFAVKIEAKSRRHRTRNENESGYDSSSSFLSSISSPLSSSTLSPVSSPSSFTSQEESFTIFGSYCDDPMMELKQEPIENEVQLCNDVSSPSDDFNNFLITCLMTDVSEPVLQSVTNELIQFINDGNFTYQTL